MPNPKLPKLPGNEAGFKKLMADAGGVMRFLSWEGYHHHLGINLLEGYGAAPVEEGVRGLRGFEIRPLDRRQTDPQGIALDPL